MIDSRFSDFPDSVTGPVSNRPFQFITSCLRDCATPKDVLSRRGGCTQVDAHGMDLVAGLCIP